MAIGTASPKPAKGTAKKAKTKRRRKLLSEDARESLKVKARSEGRCEVWTIIGWRCRRDGRQIHHMIGGRGKRAVGISALADHKQMVCLLCHVDITERRLKRVGGDLPLWTDGYTWNVN